MVEQYESSNQEHNQNSRNNSIYITQKNTGQGPVSSNLQLKTYDL